MDQIKLDNLYKNSTILDHCRNPRNYSPISKINFSSEAKILFSKGKSPTVDLFFL